MQSPSVPVVRKTFSLPATLWRKIEDYQFRQRMKKDAEVLRKLLELGLQAAEALEKDEPPAKQKAKA